MLSCRSQDAEAARKICDALRAAGVEVWFDQSELGSRTWIHIFFTAAAFATQKPDKWP